MRPHGVRLISFISYTRHIYVYSLHIIGRRTLLCLANSSQLYPPNVIRVPRAETLLTTSFRFYLTIDTLVVQLVLYYHSRTRDFHSLDINHARHTKKGLIYCIKPNLLKWWTRHMLDCTQVKYIRIINISQFLYKNWEF